MAKRRDAGLYLRGSTWYIRYVHNGKLIRKAIGTKEEARKELTAITAAKTLFLFKACTRMYFENRFPEFFPVRFKYEIFHWAPDYFFGSITQFVTQRSVYKIGHVAGIN